MIALGIRPSSMKQPLPIQHQHSSAKVNQSVQNKLQQLEELQYQITRQVGAYYVVPSELKIAQTESLVLLHRMPL